MTSALAAGDERGPALGSNDQAISLHPNQGDLISA